MTPTVFVVRADGRWLRAPAGEDTPTPISIAALLHERAEAPSVPAVPVRTSAASLDPACTVAPAWSWVGRLTAEGMVVEDATGVAFRLTDDQLRDLDLIAAPGVLDEIEAVRPGAAERLAPLVEAGLVTATGPEIAAAPHQFERPVPAEARVPPSPEAPASPGPVRRAVTWVAVAYRLSSKLAPVRRRLDRWWPRRAPADEPSVALTPPEPPDTGVSDPGETSALGSTEPPPSPGSPDAVVDLARHPDDPGGTGRIPVYAVWHPHVGPLLSLGMLTAAARTVDGGALAGVYEIRRPETAASFLADLATRTGPAILLCSDYVWSLEANLDLARQARAQHPELLIWHGGPSSPKYPDDATAFLRDHGAVADLLVRGEGEEVICELLRAVAPTAADPGRLRTDPDRLRSIGGLTFLDRDGTVVRTPDRERISALDDLPSAYLNGEFDHIDPDSWNQCLPVETNRGCPYSCTFCDWGSSTMSRIRKFSLERVLAEIDWSVERRIGSFMIADANFGILKRDVTIAEHIAAQRRATGFPTRVTVTPAKNTVRHLVKITDTLVQSGVVPTLSISLQTVDEATLLAIDRGNISVDAYLDLAADYRRHGLPLLGDVLVGMPGQSYATYRTDLQFNLDHEILVRTWPVQVLPNAPMNDPEYRAEHQIETDERHVVMATASFDREERRRMFRLRRAFVTFEVFGTVRHLLRWLQWEHDLPAIDVIDLLLERAGGDPERYPHLAWLLGYFDLFTDAPVGWTAVYDEVRRFVVDELDIVPDDALDTVLTVQHHLMPRPGRVFPATVELAHDYAAYHRDATASLYTSGRAGGPPRPLADYPPGTLTVAGDPLGLCTVGTELHGDSRDEVMQGDFYLASTSAYELDSPLARVLPHVGATFPRPTIEALVARYRPEIDAHLAAQVDPVEVRVSEARRVLQPTITRSRD